MTETNEAPAKTSVAAVDDGKPRVNTRLAIAASMTIAACRALHSTQDLFRFTPPAAPPKLRKPNRKARRARKAQARSRKG